MTKCSVQGCNRPVNGELRVADRTFPLWVHHAEVFEDRLHTLSGDDGEVKLRRHGEKP